jgi:hypothetical protein
MRKFLAKRPTPAMAVAFVALLAALSGSAIALPGTNTVDSGDIKKGAVKAADIGGNAVTSGKVKNNTLTGSDINESKLGKVPSATTADTAATATNAANATNATNATTAANANRATSAASTDGRTPFLLKLAAGQSQTIAQNGSISLVAECNSSSGIDQARILAATTTDGAILQGGENDHTGPGDFGGDFLNVATAADDRELVEVNDTEGDVTFEDDIDSSYLVGPDSKVLTLGSETTALGLNYAGAKCFIAGVVDSLG